jgi:hypothetical protein
MEFVVHPTRLFLQSPVLKQMPRFTIRLKSFILFSPLLSLKGFSAGVLRTFGKPGWSDTLSFFSVVLAVNHFNG